ncbi:cytochrome P450 family protein [Streptomyces profundus]|uniref:cytochrome P450 family protein n=1 Tax=Streptomyces profundus TaxID=2867410 RepID=UPI001D165107|nr:cytochrome P450 [Streptomyces sp. MA3_2.13]UED87788.1 cytochrome P450 [Streptomyces sp. MA3_2.13]
MTTDIPATPGDPLPTEFFMAPGDNPYAAYAEVRSSCPVHRINYPADSEAYVVADYRTVTELFGNHRIAKSVDHAPRWFREALQESSPILIKNMLTSDPPVHTRLRKLVSKAFVPRRMELLRPSIQEIADDLIDEMPETGVVDLFHDFALQIPMKVICRFLGIPVEDREQLHTWGLVLSGAPYTDEESNRRLKEVSEAVERYLVELLATRRDAMGEDLVSVIIRTAEEDDAFTDDELVSTLILLIIAGHKTTANLIGNGTQALLRHPDQLELLRTRPELVDTAVEEFLRYEGPVYRAPPRYAAEDTRVGDVDIPRESFVHLLINSANRDPEVFEDPDRLDITRKPNRHLSFGHSIHFCPGAPLSRVEGQVAFTTLLRRLPGLALAVPSDELAWRYDNSASRGLRNLPITYERRLPR